MLLILFFLNKYINTEMMEGRVLINFIHMMVSLLLLARSINGVSTTGDSTTRKGKLDALLAQTSRETQVFSLF
jgi:hypothetical protein